MYLCSGSVLELPGGTSCWEFTSPFGASALSFAAMAAAAFLPFCIRASNEGGTPEPGGGGGGLRGAKGLYPPEKVGCSEGRSSVTGGGGS